MISLPLGAGFGLAVFLKREYEAGRGVFPILETPENEGVLGIMKTSSAMQNIALAKPPDPASATEIPPENRPVREQAASPIDFDESSPLSSKRGDDREEPESSPVSQNEGDSFAAARQEPTSPMSEEIDEETEDESNSDEEEDVLARNRDFLEKVSPTSRENEESETEEKEASLSDSEDLDEIARLLSANAESQGDIENDPADLPQREPEVFDNADLENMFPPALKAQEAEEPITEPTEIAATTEPNLPGEPAEIAAASSEPIAVFKVVPQELLEIQVCSNQEFFPEPALQESVGTEEIVSEIPQEFCFSHAVDYPAEMRALTRTEDAAIVLRRSRKTAKKASPDP